MKRLFLSLVMLILQVPDLHAAVKKGATRYGVAVSATPVLNTTEFKKMFSGAIRLDPCQGVRPIEFVALPGTLFTIHEKLKKDGVTLYRVTSNDYPYKAGTPLYVDARFVELSDAPPVERARALPELAEIQRRLAAALGKPYVWGGNVKEGVPLLRSLYPQGDPLAGVDCSGLLYEATDGVTPRNTSALISFGEALPVAGLSAQAISRKLKPLDLLVWNGHVMMVLDADSIIESKMGCEGKGSGVMVTPIGTALARLVKVREPVDRYPEGAAADRSFMVRRWFPAAADGDHGPR